MNKRRPIFFALLALLVAVSSAQADFKTAAKLKIETSILTGILSKAAIESLITPCRQELGPFNPVIAFQCRRATLAFREAIGLEANRYGIMAFSAEARELLNSPEVLRYLQDLSNHDQAEALPGGLWKWTLAHPVCAGSNVRALQLIAVLFQDTKSSSYVTILDKGGALSAQQKEGISLLYKIRERLGGILQSPEELGFEQENIDYKNLYHFYVIAYASFKIATDTKDPRFGFLMPYLLNRSYELISIRIREASAVLSKSSSDQGLTLDLALTFLNPPTAKSKDLHRNFRSDFLANSPQDIYLGYRGAIFGTSLALRKPLPVMNRQEFEEAFKRSPFELTSMIFAAINKER